jgi:hypothetical protein
MARLRFLNRFILQWFFIRLTICKEDIMDDYNVISFDLTPGGMASRGTGNIKTYQWYSIQGWIVPTTGYESDFKYLNKSKKPFFFRLTKKKPI